MPMLTSADDLRDLIARHAGADKVPRRIRVIEDTTDFFRVDYDDVVVLEGRAFFVRNFEREGRFSIDDEPKFWVRRAVDLENGELKIVKMVFHERFTGRYGDMRMECVRSPRKESRVLELTRGHPRFMHGFTLHDSAANPVRVIEFIRGRNLGAELHALRLSHETYYREELPGRLDEYMELLESIAFLHETGDIHGDIRRDHLIRDSATGLLRWIDFDYTYVQTESIFGPDLAGLGNVLILIAGGGDVEAHMTDSGALSADDMNMIFRNRVANLRKLYPYMDAGLNGVLMRFSAGAEVFYDSVRQLLADLGEARERLG